jgi:hypothetical protein
MHQNLHAANPKTYRSDARLGPATDDVISGQWTIFRLRICAGAILLLIAAAVLIAAALSNAVAMPFAGPRGAVKDASAGSSREGIVHLACKEAPVCGP